MFRALRALLKYVQGSRQFRVFGPELQIFLAGVHAVECEASFVKINYFVDLSLGSLHSTLECVSVCGTSGCVKSWIL